MARIITLSDGTKYKMRMVLTSPARLSRFTDSEWHTYSAHMTVEKTDPDPRELAQRAQRTEEQAS